MNIESIENTGVASMINSIKNLLISSIMHKKTDKNVMTFVPFPSNNAGL